MIVIERIFMVILPIGCVVLGALVTRWIMKKQVKSLETLLKAERKTKLYWMAEYEEERRKNRSKKT